MDFQAAPQPVDHIDRQPYALDEQVVCRRRIAGDQPWGWNVGVMSPPLSDKPASCP